ncbi:hypothetical protein FJTKL_10266 [Diaporthe vaccinii]|uniref:Uncharacterized protein n=1 Tax=Diaporthe vaccinii TaxID=105482 RepID=A0ABR4EKB5_9PEZI
MCSSFFLDRNSQIILLVQSSLNFHLSAHITKRTACLFLSKLFAQSPRKRRWYRFRQPGSAQLLGRQRRSIIHIYRQLETPHPPQPVLPSILPQGTFGGGVDELGHDVGLGPSTGENDSLALVLGVALGAFTGGAWSLKGFSACEANVLAGSGMCFPPGVNGFPSSMSPRERKAAEGGRRGDMVCWEYMPAWGVGGGLRPELCEVEVGAGLVAHVHGLHELSLGVVTVEDDRVQGNGDDLDDDFDDHADQRPILLNG